MKRKILFILHLPPPVHGSSMVGQYVKDSILVNNTFNAKFINLSTSKIIGEIGKNPLIKISRYLIILLKIFFNLIKFNPQVVYLAITAKGIGFYKDFPIAVLSKIFGKKLVLHYHNKGVSVNQNKFLDNIMYRILFKNSKLILLSPLLYNDVVKYVKNEDVYYCSNGIKDSSGSYKSSTSNKITKLLFLSNLLESKGVFDLLLALSFLKKRKVLFHCNFIGGEGDINENELDIKIKELDLADCVSYLGKKYDSEKNYLMNNSDIFVHPTLDDCFPLVILEAMQFKLPVISTITGAIPSIVNDLETGFIVEKSNPSKLAEKIEWLINNPTKANEMGVLGRKKFQKEYTLENFEINITSILNKI